MHFQLHISIGKIWFESHFSQVIRVPFSLLSLFSLFLLISHPFLPVLVKEFVSHKQVKKKRKEEEEKS
jgi:hypothetical protein